MKSKEKRKKNQGKVQQVIEAYRPQKKEAVSPDSHIDPFGSYTGYVTDTTHSDTKAIPIQDADDL